MGYIFKEISEEEKSRLNLHKALQDVGPLYIAYIPTFVVNYVLDEPTPTVIKIVFSVSIKKKEDLDYSRGCCWLCFEQGGLMIKHLNRYQILEDYGQKPYGQKDCCYATAQWPAYNVCNTFEQAKIIFNNYKEEEKKSLERKYILNV